MILQMILQDLPVDLRLVGRDIAGIRRTTAQADVTLNRIARAAGDAHLPRRLHAGSSRDLLRRVRGAGAVPGGRRHRADGNGRRKKREGASLDQRQAIAPGGLDERRDAAHEEHGTDEPAQLDCRQYHDDDHHRDEAQHNNVFEFFRNACMPSPIIEGNLGCQGRLYKRLKSG